MRRLAVAFGRGVWRLLCIIWPPVEARPVNHKLRQQLEREMVQIGSSDTRYTDWFELSAETLQQLVLEEDRRASALEDKLAKISVVLGIGLTIGGAIGKSLSDGVSTHWVKAGVSIGLLLSMLYLISGGWVAFRSGMTAKPRGGIGADWAIDVNGSPKSSRISGLIQFEKTNLIRNNDISVAIDCVRNGLVLFAIIVLMALADPLFVMLQAAQSTPSHYIYTPGPFQSEI